MQLKDSLLLLTALTAGSAIAHPHGHGRRHAHQEKRAVGDIVTVTMDGKVVTWVNEYAGGAAPTTTVDNTAAKVAAETEAANPVATDAAATAAAPTDSTTEATPTATTVASGSCANWDDTPADGSYSRDGFGGVTASNLLEYIWYTGNVGSPWGSNIKEVDASNACNYKHVVKFSGVDDLWTVVFWNKMGPDGKLTGWYGNSALTITLQAGETKYVAFDDDTQGAWGAAKGDSLPTDQYGGYSCTWGEFDFSNKGNNEWSGWDVSAIQAQNANQEVQGMKICDNVNGGCSSISNLASQVVNAYTAAEEGVDGIGGSMPPGAVRLVTILDFN